jgi:hypothetical protein
VRRSAIQFQEGLVLVPSHEALQLDALEVCTLPGFGPLYSQQ